MAQAIAKLKYSDVFNAHSAGSEMSRGINEDAIRIIKQRYGIDMSKTQKPKLIEDLPKLKVSITMGCDVVCPLVKNQYTEDWDLDDPSNHSDAFFNEVIDEIELKMAFLVKKIKAEEI